MKLKRKGATLSSLFYDSDDSDVSEGDGEDTPPKSKVSKVSKVSKASGSSQASSSTDVGEETAEDKTPDEKETPEETSDKKVPGVYQIKKTGRWRGQVYNSLEKNSKGGLKYEYTRYFATEAEAIAARNKLNDQVQREIKEHYEVRCPKLAAEDPLTRDLERAPENVRDAKPNTKYWHANGKTPVSYTHLTLPTT